MKPTTNRLNKIMIQSIGDKSYSRHHFPSISASKLNHNTLMNINWITATRVPVCHIQWLFFFSCVYITSRCEWCPVHLVHSDYDKWLGKIESNTNIVCYTIATIASYQLVVDYQCAFWWFTSINCVYYYMPCESIFKKGHVTQLWYKID